MSRPLTDRQMLVLRGIASVTAARRIPPTVRELGELLGITSTNGIVDHLKALEAKGLVTREARVARSLLVTEQGRRVIKTQLAAEIARVTP